MFSHWNECSICGESPMLCKCTHEQKQAYEERCKLVREAANVKNKLYEALVEDITGEKKINGVIYSLDPVVKFDEPFEVEHLYNKVPEIKEDWLTRRFRSFAERSANPMHNLQLDMMVDNPVIKLDPHFKDQEDRLQVREASLEDIKELFPDHTVERVPATPGPTLRLEVASDEDIEEAIPTEITFEQKYFMMLAMGFQPRGKGIWIHSSLIEPLSFDLHTQDIDKLVFKINQHGFRSGQQALKDAFKELLS